MLDLLQSFTHSKRNRRQAAKAAAHETTSFIETETNGGNSSNCGRNSNKNNPKDEVVVDSVGRNNNGVTRETIVEVENNQNVSSRPNTSNSLKVPNQI